MGLWLPNVNLPRLDLVGLDLGVTWSPSGSLLVLMMAASTALLGLLGSLSGVV